MRAMSDLTFSHNNVGPYAVLSEKDARIKELEHKLKNVNELKYQLVEALLEKCKEEKRLNERIEMLEAHINNITL